MTTDGPICGLTACLENCLGPILGQKQTYAVQNGSALAHVCFGPKADVIQTRLPGFLGKPESGSRLSSTRPLIASSSGASAERDVGHQAFQLSRRGLRKGLERQ